MPSRSRKASTAASVRKLRSAPPPPDEQHFDMDSAIAQMSDNQIMCRELRHAWKPWTVHTDTKAKLYEVKLRCTKCKTVRVREIGFHGQLIGNRYEYPDGYLVKGLGRLDDNDRARLRLESVFRLLPSQEKIAAG